MGSRRASSGFTHEEFAIPGAPRVLTMGSIREPTLYPSSIATSGFGTPLNATPGAAGRSKRGSGVEVASLSGAYYRDSPIPRIATSTVECLPYQESVAGRG
jgi:hypothetical protein